MRENNTKQETKGREVPVIKQALTGLILAVLVLFVYTDAEADRRKHLPSSPAVDFVSSDRFADNMKYFYGGPKKGRYGEKQSVITKDAARSMLKDQIKGDAKIGKTRERKLYYEFDITGKDGKLIDRVIIDKRTGRIRSVY